MSLIKFTTVGLEASEALEKKKKHDCYCKCKSDRQTDGNIKEKKFSNSLGCVHKFDQANKHRYERF